MMRSLFSGVSGLKNHQTRMDVIGNNISNVNTTGYKSSRVNFTDMLSQNLQGASSPNANIGGTNPKQIGLGSAVGAVDLLFTNGSVQSTGVNTDLALSSTNSLFILNTGNGTAYTRNGDFQFDADGNYVQAGNGYFVQGWMADSTGGIDINKGVQNITIPSGKTMKSSASSLVRYTNNLNAEVPVITNIVGGVQNKHDEPGWICTATNEMPITLKLSDGSTETVTEGTYTVGETYSTTPVSHTTPGESVVVSDDNSPVTATLKGGRTVEASDASSEWHFGYNADTPGASDTASATKTITLYSEGGKKESGVSGTKYIVGNDYMGSIVTESGEKVTSTNDPKENIVWLYLDGNTDPELAHNVTNTAADYIIGTSTYTWTDDDGNDHTGTVTGYSQGFNIHDMDVVSPAGPGATVAVGGIASRTVNKDGDTVTATDDNTVTITLANGQTVTGISGKTYEVGADSETDPDTTPGHSTGAASSTNRVHLYLADGTEIKDEASGNNYTVGDAYEYSTGEAVSSSTTGDKSGAASGTNHVHLVFTDETTFDDKFSGINYEVGQTYPIQTGSNSSSNPGDKSGEASSTNHVHLFWDDDTETDDIDSGTDYEVGLTYGGKVLKGFTSFQYAEKTVKSFEATPFAQTTINGFSTLSKIKSIEEKVDITQVDETAKVTIESISLPGTSATSDNPVTLTLSDGSTLVQTSGSYDIGHSTPIVTTIALYDTLGSVHDLPVYFTMTDAAEDTWNVALTTDGSSTTSWTEADGSITTATLKPISLDFDQNGAFASGTGTTTLTLTNGSATPQTIQMDFSQMTQYSSSSTIAGKANGNAAGTLSSISIDKTGTITGTYTNGMKKVEAQVALQRFNNPGGLTKVGESLYEDSNNAGLSGSPNTASALGATITPAALEMSNVDIANEFTDMIITQRGFQGNSKIITVSDEMLETLINMKR